MSVEYQPINKSIFMADQKENGTQNVPKEKAKEPVLKYKSEIDKHGITTIGCPDKAVAPQNIIAFRLVWSPIDHKDNFLPNIIIEVIRKIPFVYAKDKGKREIQICSRCSISLYNSLENVQCMWDNASAKFKENFGYTHIAEGEINEGDGLVGSISKVGHFGFYEYDGANIFTKFKLKQAI